MISLKLIKSKLDNLSLYPIILEELNSTFIF